MVTVFVAVGSTARYMNRRMRKKMAELEVQRKRLADVTGNVYPFRRTG